MTPYTSITVGAADILEYLRHGGLSHAEHLTIDTSFEDAVIIWAIAEAYPHAVTISRQQEAVFPDRTVWWYGTSGSIGVEIAPSFFEGIQWLQQQGALPLRASIQEFSTWMNKREQRLRASLATQMHISSSHKTQTWLDILTGIIAISLLILCAIVLFQGIILFPTIVASIALLSIAGSLLERWRRARVARVNK
jgi:hypothetical protein